MLITIIKIRKITTKKSEYYFLRMHVYKWAGKIGVINYNNEAFVHEI